MNYIKLLIRKIDKILSYLTIFLLKIRQKSFSPDKGILSPVLKGKICVHRPHCSQYCIEALKRFGFFVGIEYCFNRVISCHPFGKDNKFFIGDKIYDPVMYKVVFFSSAQIGVSFLKKLFEDKRFEVVGVVTTPPKPAGRGLRLTPTPIQKFVEKMGKDVENFLKKPSKLKGNEEFKQWLKNLNPDFIIVISYGKIIPKDILDIPKIAPINVHGSLLPKYRGASPIQSVLLDGERQTGITIMKMNEKLDEGDIIKKLKFNIPFDWTAKDIIDKMIEVGPQFLVDTLFEYAKGEIKEIPQNHNEATYCKKITKEDGKIDPFNDSLDLIYRKYRAFILWPGVYFYNTVGGKNKLFKITNLKLNEDKFKEFKQKPLFFLNNGKIELNPAVIEIKIRPEGKRDLTFEEFVRGYFKSQFFKFDGKKFF